MFIMIQDCSFSCSFLWHWSRILREEHRLRVFQNSVLSRIFEPKGDEITGGRRELHHEELHNLYYSPNIF
jgi:hypothetical protein